MAYRDEPDTLHTVHPALEAIRAITAGTEYERELWLVGGAVRDEMLALPVEADFDLVLRGSSAELAKFLFKKKISRIPPVTYERFGTAMISVDGVQVELVTARKESYASESRKPSVEPATLEEDALRRDFTVNTLLRNLHSGDLLDPLGSGQTDLKNRVLRTPVDPRETFHDDPLRMLRAVRFRWKLGFAPVEGLYEAIKKEAHRLKIISGERIRDELLKMLAHPTAPDAMQDLLDLNLLQQFAPQFSDLVGLDQGEYHHLDAWDHTMLVLRNVGSQDRVIALGALLHDIGKPETRTVEASGKVRFLGHDVVGSDIAGEVLRGLRLGSDEIGQVQTLIKNHMRLVTTKPFSKSAARRLVRDLGDLVDPLLVLAEADAAAHKPGRTLRSLDEIRRQVEEVQRETPREALVSPLSGNEIAAALGIEPGPEIGKWKGMLTEKVLDGIIAPGDKRHALAMLLEAAGNAENGKSES